jgi:MFS family permease
MFLPAGRPLAIALLVAGAFFMENLDGTVIATAMPQMARSFGASPVDLNIGMTAYLLALAVFIPISGWLTAPEDRKNKKHTIPRPLTAKRLQAVPVEVSTTSAQPGSSLTGPISNLAAMK